MNVYVHRQFWYGVVVGAFASVGLTFFAGCSTDILDVTWDAPEVASAAVASPNVAYVRWADGNPTGWTSPLDPCSGHAPPASKLTPDERAEVMRLLREWSADFNLEWREDKGNGAFSVVVSDGPPDWCGLPAYNGGIAPFLCHRLPSGTAYAFSTKGAFEVAVTIAQEYAHMLGLEHTVDHQDVMCPYLSDAEVGFVDMDVETSGDKCGRATQNSHAMMLAALGAR